MTFPRLPFLLLAVFATASLHAETATHELDHEFSGASDPGSATKPWLTAHYDDEGSLGSVKLTLTATNLLSGEFVSGWYINLNPALDPGALSIVKSGKNGTFDDPSISQSTDAYKADGDGFYDIKFNFTNSGQGGGSRRFRAEDWIMYTITGIAGLEASDFDWGSKDSGNGQSFLSAAHVQGIAGGNSGWIAPDVEPPDHNVGDVPEPASIFAWLASLVGLCWWRRRRR